MNTYTVVPLLMRFIILLNKLKVMNLNLGRDTELQIVNLFEQVYSPCQNAMIGSTRESLTEYSPHSDYSKECLEHKMLQKPTMLLSLPVTILSYFSFTSTP